MVYILLAIALLAALTMTMMRGNETGGDDLSKDEAELLAAQVIAYAGSAKQVVDNMMMSGTPVASLNFVMPNQTSFDTGSHIHKVYHPAGGGLNYKAADPKIFDTTTTPTQGFYIGRFNNTVWTQTTAFDVMFTAYGLKRPICESINKKITGSTTIPAFAGGGKSRTVEVIHHGIGNLEFTNLNCAGCEGFPAMCASDVAGTVFIYYNIISPQ